MKRQDQMDKQMIANDVPEVSAELKKFMEETYLNIKQYKDKVKTSSS